MAGDWIKMRCELQSHPKIVRILSITKSDKFRVVGGLHAVWSVFDAHSKDGTLVGYTPELMDHVIGWDGFSGAMVSVGWLRFDDTGTLMLPEFDEHNSKSAKRRAEDQKRKRNERNSPNNVTDDCGQNADRMRTREEKRREEEKEKEKEKEKPPKLRKRSSAITIQEFFTQCEANSEKRIPEDDPVFDYAERIGIALEMVKVCWQEFVRTHTENGKKQADWRATFRNYVRKNYYKLWYVEADGSVKETPQFRALKKVGEANYAQH